MDYLPCSSAKTVFLIFASFFREIILVNRGWIPKKNMDPDTRKEGQVTGEIELNGIVRIGEARPQFQPDHNKGNIYLYRDFDRMCKATGAVPVFIDADVQSSVPAGPVGGQTRVTLRNEHMSYIITWFSLSAFTSIMWFKQILKRVPF
jgi:surfeit locus 1 family protein